MKLFIVLFSASLSAQLVPTAVKQGHSHLGEPFDSGPREKPWPMSGIGSVNFPITTANPEVQKWFNQGVALSHNFWWYEAERSFRWCQKLEPENPMPYWGLALAAQDDEKRAAGFIKEAARRQAKASPRERLYIDAWYARIVKDPILPTEGEKRSKDLMESLIIRYPDDLEAKTFLALSMMGDQRMGAEKLLQEVLAKDPNHPGAHHYRIHNWNYHEETFALDSCRRYGQIAHEVGHALHMPGHIYSTIGMWHEAAISMDSATRNEARYMKDRMVLPFNAWNYPHNKNYLCRVQEQLGMPDMALDGARQLLSAAPGDAKSTYTNTQGLFAFLRNVAKFDRWKLYQDSAKSLPWRDQFLDRILHEYMDARAHLARGDQDKALDSYQKHGELKKDLEKNKWLEKMYHAQSKELRARLLLARGETLAGLNLLGDAAATQFGDSVGETEILQHPEVIWIALGDAYLDHKSPLLAVPAYEKALKVTRTDGFALAGLVRAHHALGETDQARARMAQLLAVWSDAEPGLKLLELARATGVTAEPKDNSPAPQRNYRRTTLDEFGPNRWQPYPAPNLDAVDSDGQRVTLAEYRGKNVLLIFYLGDECPHCLDQLVQIGKRKADFERANTVLLAISKDTPEENKASRQMGEVPFRLLSDARFENAKRFHSFDDFENLELHSTILVDTQGRVHWARNGGDPFVDFDFLLKELARLNIP